MLLKIYKKIIDFSITYLYQESKHQYWCMPCFGKQVTYSLCSDFFKERKMNAKVFSQRFNRELAALGLPDDLHDKTKAVAKVFGVTRHMANAMIFGHLTPNDDQLENIAATLEVCPKWLSGVSDRKKAYSPKSSDTEVA